LSKKKTGNCILRKTFKFFNKFVLKNLNLIISRQFSVSFFTTFNGLLIKNSNSQKIVKVCIKKINSFKLFLLYVFNLKNFFTPTQLSKFIKLVKINLSKKTKQALFLKVVSKLLSFKIFFPFKKKNLILIRGH
jgi:hypothetical protein